MTTDDKIINDYAYHKPDADGIAKINKLRKFYSQLDTMLNELDGNVLDIGRAKTRLKESMMWANSSIAMQYPAEEV